MQLSWFIAGKSCKKMHSFRFIATKSRKKLQSSRFIANTSRESCNHLNLSPTKFVKMYSLFFNHLDLPLAKVGLMLFCQKLSRLIARKSWEKLQWFQFTASKNLKKVLSFRFIFSKNCNEFFQSTQFTASKRLLFWGQGE